MEPSIEQLDQILEGVQKSMNRESARGFLRVWIRDWTAHKVSLMQEKQEQEQEPHRKAISHIGTYYGRKNPALKQEPLLDQ